MDRNLEKNLRKIHAMRAKGQLDKALKQLQDWAKKHTDTPHYQYEAAMVALDLGDHATGLRWLKNLLRTAPDSRGRILDSITERYREEPILPLAEFLVERHLSDPTDLDAVFEVVGQLGENELESFRQKLAVRHRSLAVNHSPELARTSYHSQMAVAHALERPEEFAAHLQGLLDEIPEDAAELALLGESELAQAKRCAPLLHATGACHAAAGRAGRAAELLVTAGTRDTSLAPGILEEMRAAPLPTEDRGTWLRAMGELALLSGEWENSAELYREAADCDPTGRAKILERLENLPPSLEPEQAGPLWKLQLRLLVVMRRVQSVPGVLERLRKHDLVDPDELRALMGEGKSGSEKPSEMSFLLAEAALRAFDLGAAAAHAAEIPDNDQHSLHKVIRTIEAVKEDWEEEGRLELMAFMAVIYARLGEQHGTNDTLAGLWEGENDAAALVSVTESCLQRIHPSARLLTSMLAPCLHEGQLELLSTALDSLLRNNADDLRWFVDDLVQHLDEHQDQAERILELLDRADRTLGATQQLRYPVACAALACGKVARAVPEFQVLLMARPQLAGEVLDRLRAALENSPQDADLNLAAFDLLWEAKELDEAGDCLARALAADPQRIEELSGRYEQLLEQAPKRAELWLSYAQALYSVGRYAQLQELVERAVVSNLAWSGIADLRLLMARVQLDEGDLDAAVGLVELLLEEGEVHAERAAETLEAVVHVHPTHARAQLLLGRACASAGDLDRSIPALCAAARADHSLVSEIALQLETLAAQPAATATHLMAVGDFDRRFRDAADAARNFDRALRLEPTISDRILSELASESESPHGAIPLLYVASRAARQAGKLDLACTLLTQIYSQDTQEFGRVVTELGLCAEENPSELGPARANARILLANKEAEAAADLIADIVKDHQHPLESRREVLEEFHQRVPEHAGLLAALARVHGESGDLDRAAELMWEALDQESLDPEYALPLMAELLDQAPEHGELRMVQHDLLLLAGRIEEALDALPEPSALEGERLKALDERLAAASRRGMNSVALALRQAETLRRRGEREDSIEVLRRAAEQAEGTEKILVCADLARGLEHLGRHEEARKSLAVLVDEGMDWTEIYGTMGKAKQERVERECAALRQRVEDDPTDTEAHLQLAALLMEVDAEEEATRLLEHLRAEDEYAMRRACLLGDAHLRRGRCDRAEPVLRAMEGRAEGFWVEEIGWRLARCAELLGRHADAYARYQSLFDSERYGDRARARAHTAYGRHLKDLAGEYYAVLTGTSDIQTR